MPKLSQNFLKGKMNKDLDERLVPKGEYRLAQNILITHSEDSDVGAVENIKGNTPAHAYQIGIGWPNGNSVNINSLANDAVFFPTLISGNPATQRPFETIGYYADILNNRVFWFLTNWTFSGSSTERTSNVINSLQTSYPRRANADSVCHILMCDLNETTSNTDNNLPPVHRLVSGHFLNFSKNHLITGVNIIDNLLFWTDDYNQPRKINVNRALNNPLYYDTEEKISVAKFAPYLPIRLVNRKNKGHDTTLINDVNIKSDYLKENFVRFSYRYKYKDGEYSTMAPFTQIIFAPLNDAVISNESLNKYGYEKIHQNTTVELMQNSYNKLQLRIPLYSPENLTSPEQDSNNNEIWINHLDIDKIELLVKQSNENIVRIAQTIDITPDFLENINQDESTTSTGEVLNSNSTEYYTVTPGADDTYFRYVYRYIYKSEEPYKALPEAQMTRVYDHVPIKAKAQEMTGNRVIYGNYLENHPIPIDSKGNTGINYVVSSANKGDLEYGNAFGLMQYLDVSYKYHSIKQRRNYQVGIILADKYGRQSTVILSSNKDHPYLSDTYRVDRFHAPTGNSWSAFDNIESIGKSLAITFLDDKPVETRYIYNGDKDSPKYNPTGWYSWRLVIKQKEQEYYNVYAVHPAENWNALSDAIDNSASGSSWLTLYGDNINKVPRLVNKDDANRIGSSSSEIKLFPRVIKNQNNSSDGYSVYSSFTQPQKVLSIGTSKEQGLIDDDGISYSFLGSNKREHLVAEIPSLNGENTPVFKTTAVVLEDVASFSTEDDESKFVLLKNRNYYIKKGHYIQGDNVIDRTVASLTATAVANGVSKLRFTTVGVPSEATASTYDSYYFIKKDHYISGGDITDPNGETFPVVVTDVEVNVIGEDNLDRELIVTLDRNVSLTNTIVEFKEFTTIKNITDVAMGYANYQRLELSYTQGEINANDILTFRIIDGNPISVSRGLSVFETEPFKSNLDIFYETSTSGLLSDLNSESNIDTSNPFNITISNNEFYENQSVENQNNIIGVLTAESGIGDPNAIFTFDVHSIDSENTDWEPGSPPFVAGTQNELRVIPGFVWNPQVGEEEKNHFVLNIKCTELTAPGAPSTFGTIDLYLKNITPALTENIGSVVLSGNTPEAMENTVLFECKIENGSARDELKSRHLKVVLASPYTEGEIPMAGPSTPPGMIGQVAMPIDTNHYSLNNTGPDGVNFGMLKHEIVSDEEGSILRILCTSNFHAGYFLFGDPLWNVVNGIYMNINPLPLRPVEERTITVYINDGGDGTSWSEDVTDGGVPVTEWNPEGITISTSFIVEPATVENGHYRIPVYVIPLDSNNNPALTIGIAPGAVTPIIFGYDPNMKWVSIGSSISPPTIDEPCSTAESGNGVFCPHTLYLDNRAWNDPWSQIPAHNPGLQDSNGNYRYRYLAATQLFSGSVLKIMVVNQLGYIISANEIWED